MAMGKELDLDLSTIVAGAPSQKFQLQQSGRIDEMHFDHKNQSMILVLNSYASPEAARSGMPIQNSKEKLVFDSHSRSGSEAILDPDTGEELEPMHPGIPALTDLFNEPLKNTKQPQTLKDLYDWMRAELYARLPNLVPQWTDSNEV